MSSEKIKSQKCPQCSVGPTRLITVRDNDQTDPVWIGCPNCMVKAMTELKQHREGPCSLCGAVFSKEFVSGEKGGFAEASVCTLHFHARSLLARALQAVRSLQGGSELDELCGDLSEILEGSR